MALSFTRAEVIAKARRILGATDSSKGGPTDNEILPDLNDAISKFVAHTGSLKTVIGLYTQANDPYLPLVDEILWPITVTFIDTSGREWPLGQVETAPVPNSVGAKPEVWWLTAVNVPDVTGPSTRTIGIDPHVNYTADPQGDANVRIEAIQLAAELDATTSVPELHVCLHGTLAYCLALEMLPLFPERIGLEAFIRRQIALGTDLFQKLCRGDNKAPHGGHDVMRYRERCRSRF